MLCSGRVALLTTKQRTAGSLLKARRRMTSSAALAAPYIPAEAAGEEARYYPHGLKSMSKGAQQMLAQQEFGFLCSPSAYAPLHRHALQQLPWHNPCIPHCLINTLVHAGTTLFDALKRIGTDFQELPLPSPSMYVKTAAVMYTFDGACRGGGSWYS
jgi:hypothetical protein